MSIGSVSPASSVFYQPALTGLAQATQRIQDSTFRLSTNNRFARASDDVANQAIATKFSYALSGQRQALQNAGQASSLLQVAYGGLNNISDILSSMQALATQANSGSLSASELLNLDAQYQKYVAQIDSLANNTNFGGIKLLDGSVNAENQVQSNSGAATRGSAQLSFTALGAGQTVVLNGQTLTVGTQFALGGSLTATVDNLVNYLNTTTNTALNGATYARIPATNNVSITYDAGGTLSNQYVVNRAASTSTFTVAGGSTVTANIFTTQGGANDGLFFTGVNVSGTIGDTLVNTQSQVSASQTLTTTGIINVGEQLRIDNGNGGTVNFNFTNAPVAATDILIGATTRDTLANAVAVINNYSATNDYGVRQLEATRSGSNTLTLTYKAAGNANDLVGAALDVTETFANASLSGATFNNGTNTGVNTDGVTNASFVGTISGFSSTFVGADSVTAQITVGSDTYSAAITDTTPAANNTIRFRSTNGGFFDVQFASAGGQTVNNQTDADTFAARLDAAFGGLSFYQTRNVTNFTGAGQLTGASLEITLSDFTNPVVQDIQVTGSPGVGFDATIDFTINGETFRSPAGIGSDIGDKEVIRFTSLTDSNRFITLRNGTSTIDLSNQTNADTFEASLKSAIGYGTGGGSLNVQVGGDPTDSIGIRIQSVTSNSLFAGVAYDLTTQPNAALAQTALDTAIDTVTSVTADVGAYQARFDSTSSNLNNSITYTDEARARIADTDIASEATNFALAQLQANSAIAVLAQITTLSSGLLDLLKK